MLKCPDCDGALLANKRCVRCGQAKAPIESLEDLLARGAKVSFKDGVVMVDHHYIRVGYSEVMLSAPSKSGLINQSMNLVSFDLTIEDSGYWRYIRSRIFGLLPKHPNVANVLWKKVKGGRLRTRAKRWEEAVPLEIARWAWGVLNTESHGLDCIDNYRCARVNNSPQMRRYLKQRYRGCCGSRDFRRRGPDGFDYVMGFNYGH